MKRIASVDRGIDAHRGGGRVVGAARAGPDRRRPATPCATLDPALFVSVIDNPYYPLPVGRTLVYRGMKDGQTQVDRVRVTSRTKVIGGVTATVVRDVARHGSTRPRGDHGLVRAGRRRERLLPGRGHEALRSERPGRHVGLVGGRRGRRGGRDHHGGGSAGPGRLPAGVLLGEAEDTAWITNASGSITVPYGTVHDVVTSLEHIGARAGRDRPEGLRARTRDRARARDRRRRRVRAGWCG